MTNLSITNLFNGKTVLIGKGTKTTTNMATSCPNCKCDVPIRNDLVLQMVLQDIARGILCDGCRRENLSDEVK